MAETNTDSATKKLVVVTGANEGIGFEICRQLASNGLAVVLTARDETKGVAAVEKLNGLGLSDVVFNQLDVMDPASVASLADFIKTQFGKLDILVNNAGINGSQLDEDANKVVMAIGPLKDSVAKYKELARETPEMAEEYVQARETPEMAEEYVQARETPEMPEECVQANYYGAKRVTETLLPLLQLSESPRIINISSTLGKLQNVTDTWAKEVLSDEDGLTEERVDDVLNKFLKDFKENHRWPAYTMSKAAINAYTRILARKFPKFRINCVCPGYVKTAFNYNTRYLAVEEGAAGPVKLALLPDDGPSGLFFHGDEVSTF